MRNNILSLIVPLSVIIMIIAERKARFLFFIFSRISCIQNFFLSGLCLSAIVTTHMCRAHPCIQKLREWFIEPFSEFFVSIVLRCRNKKCSGFLNYFPIQRSASSMPQRFAPEYGNFMASKIFIRK